VIDDPAFRQTMTLSGQDVASLYLQVLEIGGRTDYMRYRTVPVFPQVGDKINKAIERIATGQADARTAMEQAQQQSIEGLAKAGVKL
jgi:multiple sugar transport system substrate-binding protein